MKNQIFTIVLALFLSLTTASNAQTISTIAGAGQQFPIAAKQLSIPWVDTVATDSGGNVIVGSTSNDRIYRITPNGTVTVIAGIGSGGYSGDGGAATEAEINNPTSISLDANGNIFFVDSGNYRIRKIDSATGIISTLAGSGDPTIYTSDGPALETAVGAFSITASATGEIYFSDYVRLKWINPATGRIETIAGTSQQGNQGDDGPAIAATFGLISGIALDKSQNIYICDLNYGTVRKIERTTGIITKIAGDASGRPNYDGAPALQSGIANPWALQVNDLGEIYILEYFPGGVRKIDQNSGLIYTIAGSKTPGFGGDGGSAQGAQLYVPRGLALDAQGNIYIADMGNHRVRRISSATGTIETFAGFSSVGSFGDGGPAYHAGITASFGLAVSSSGEVFFTDSTGNLVRRIDSSGNITAIAGNGSYGKGPFSGLARDFPLYTPIGLTRTSAGEVLFTEANNAVIRKLNISTGIFETIAGTGAIGFSGDGGPALQANVMNPWDLKSDINGNLYFTDLQRVRKIDSVTGIITTIAGTNSNTEDTGDGGPAILASLNNPTNVEIDRHGNVYISTFGYRVRKIDANTGIISTVAGNGTRGPSLDGVPATTTPLMHPFGLLMDRDDNLFIADYEGHKILRIDASTGIINTIAGLGVPGILGDNGPARLAKVNYPIALAADESGNLYFTEGQGRIRKITNVMAPLDPNPPVVEHSITGVVGTNDWYTSDATLAWTISDPDSPIRASSGCEGASVNSDTSGITFTCTVTSAGGTTTKSVTIKRDATSPVATATPSPLPNSAGWNNGLVSVVFTGTDATSGVASCSTADSVATEGAAQTSAAGTCTDNAGNVSAPVTFSPINIDLTPPSVRGIPSPASNAAGWNNTAVTVSYTGEDALSGVAADGCSAPQTLTASGAGQSATGTCADRAGNSASVTVSGINIDTVAPVAYASVSPAANAANWHKSPVTVSFTGTDSISGSGIAACSGNANVTADGGGQTRSGTCGDIAGNTSASAIATVNLDQTVPVVSITSPTSGGSYTQGSTLTAAFSCTDATSGINGCVGSVNSGQPISTATLGQMGFAAAATDFAGNSTLQTVYYTVTAPAPAFTLAPNSLAFGSQALNTATGLVVSIRNAGGTTLTLGTTSITGTHANQFTRTSACGTTLAAGGSCSFSISFKPTSAGSKVATFSVSTSTAGTKTVALSGTGVAAAYTLSPTALTFPSTTRNTTSAGQRVTVTNTSTVAMPITSITLGGTNANQFVKTQTCGVSLAANSSCYVDVAFKPTTSGSKSATLAVTPGGGAMVKNVSLKGTGL